MHFCVANGGIEMFVSKTTFERVAGDLSSQIDFERNRYWELRLRVDRLIEHLGLYEQPVAARVLLLSKSGPEPSE